jgi:hypothetical protein
MSRAKLAELIVRVTLDEHSILCGASKKIAKLAGVAFMRIGFA